MMALKTHISISISRNVFPYEYEYAYERQPTLLDYGIKDVVALFPDHHVAVAKFKQELPETIAAVMYKFVIHWSCKENTSGNTRPVLSSKIDDITDALKSLKLQMNAVWYAPHMPGFILANDSFEESVAKQ